MKTSKNGTTLERRMLVGIGLLCFVALLTVLNFSDGPKMDSDKTVSERAVSSKERKAIYYSGGGAIHGEEYLSKGTAKNSRELDHKNSSESTRLRSKAKERNVITTQKNELDSDPFDWVQNYEKDFLFTMKPSPACDLLINDENLLVNLARIAIADWEQNGNERHPTPSMAAYNDRHTRLTPELETAEKTWRTIMEACHGPLPDFRQHPELAQDYSLRTFMKGLAHCGDERGMQGGGHPMLFEGGWCIGGWHETLKMALHPDLRKERMETTDWKGDPYDNWFSSDLRENAFVMTSRCALKFEWPIVSVPQLPPSEKATNRQRKGFLKWKPKRTIILTPTMGPTGATMGCRLVSTAFPRGWEIVLIEGEYRGIRYKYSDAIRALRMVVEESGVAAEDTLVVFADSMDVLAQRTPEYVAEAFLNTTSLFSFSSEPFCFPMASWPHSLGTPFQACDDHYPETKNHYINGHKYANTGGWIGLASSAFVVLKELASIVENEGVDKKCHETGTDQLIGNAAYLRSPSLLGLDYEYSIFASGSWGLMHAVFTELSPSSPPLNDNNLLYGAGSNQRSAAGEDRFLAPAFLHFNGGSSSGGKLDEATAVLSSGKSLLNCRKGKITIAHIGEGKVWEEDFFTTDRWQECRKNNHCANASTS